MKTQMKHIITSPSGQRHRAGIVPTLLGLILLASSTIVTAQGLSWGLQAGVTSSDIKIDRSLNNVMEGKNIYGAEAGVYIKPQLGPFYVKPTLLYDYRMGNVNNMPTSSETNTDPGTTKFTMHSLQLPMMLGFHIVMPVVFVEAGPVYNYILGVTEKYNNNTVDLNRNGFGYRIGAGADLKALMIHAHYQGLMYNTSGGQATFKDPSKFIFGVSVPLSRTE